MKNLCLTKCHWISDKMQVNLDMFSPLMLDWVGGEAHGADVITVNKSGLARWTVQLLQ
jgi:hypothetical protein